MTTQGKRRFGKARVEGCECDYRFTCRACCEAACARDGLTAKPISPEPFTVAPNPLRYLDV